MYTRILLNPLLSCFTLLLQGRYLGRKGAIGVALACMGVAWRLNFKLLVHTLATSTVTLVHLAPWIDSGLLHVPATFLFDGLTVTMSTLVLTVSLGVHVYAVEYMRQDPHLQRFLRYLSLFTFFMLCLITANNLVLLFVGWEGVGLCSYLLIAFWYTRLDACKRAVKAVLFNKVGDCSLLLGMGLVFYLTQSLSFQVMFAVLPYFATSVLSWGYVSCTLMDLIGATLLLAAMGKSAQFFLHPWLADAMEGPTPVSALIHAATMVTAGIYLLIRCSYLLEYAHLTTLLAFIGSLTILFASTAAFFQFDLKKIIAYSTCSQLGYMLTACAFSGYKVALFHLFNHGFFKALLFLSAGLLIHNWCEEQDLRKMGGLRHSLPLTYTFFLVGSLALMGTPFLAGFYSKDVILETLYVHPTAAGFIAYHLALFSAALTALYSLRLLYYAFWSEPLGFKHRYKHLGGPEATLPTLSVLFILAVCSIVVGYLGKDLFLGMGSDMYAFAIYEAPQTALMDFVEFRVPFPVKSLPLLTVLGGTLLFAYLVSQQQVYTRWSSTHRTAYAWFTFFNQAWFMDYIYARRAAYGYLLARQLFYLDKVVLERTLPLAAHQSLLARAKSLTLGSRTSAFTQNVVALGSLLLFLYIL